MILIAAILLSQTGAADPVAAQEVGPFRITAEVKHIDSAPYPSTFRLVTIKTKDTSGFFSYELVDDGEFVRPIYTVGGCMGGGQPVPLQMSEDRFFSAAFINELLSYCPSPDAASLTAFLSEAYKSFPSAFRAYRGLSSKLHGPSERRCAEDEFGNHGRVCKRYLPEAPDAQAH